MKFATRLNVTATVAAGIISTLTLGAAVLGRRTLQQEIDAGIATNDTTAIKVGDTGVPFMVENLTTGDWEAAYYTITSKTVITKGAIIASSNAGAAVSFPAGAVNVFNAPLGGWLGRLITIDDAVSMPGLPLGTATSNGLLLQYNPATGNTETVTVASLLALVGGSAPSGGTTAQSITVNTIATQTAGAAFSVTGTYANGTPTALQWSTGGTWNNATATISGGTYTITGVTVPAASNSQTVMVRDASTLVSGTSPAFLVTAAPYITTNTPNSQVVNVAFPVTGWYYNYTPTAFDYRFSDDAAGVWTQAAAGSTVISGGNWQFSVTCSTTNASRTVTVRDRTTQTILATSGAFAVTAAAATVTGVAVTPSPATVVGGKTQQFTATVSGANSPSQGVAWALVSGPGSISASGLYTAPTATAAAQSAVIKAVSQQDGTTASPNVTITIPAQTIGVDSPGTTYANTAFTLTGTWTGAQPATLEFQYADNGGTATAWTSLAGATINANGTWSASVTYSSTSTSRVMSVRDAATLVAGSSTANAVNSASQTIGVTTPATQTAYRSYTLSGTWTGTQPTALEYRTTDNGGTPTAWASLSGASILANGTWSATVTPTTYSSSRVMSVRDSSTLFSGSSSAYIVQSMAQAYKVTNTNAANMLEGTTTASAPNPDYAGSPGSNIRVNLRDAGGVSISAATQAKLVFGLYNDSNCPATFGGGFPVNANGCTNSSSHTNAIATCSALNWTLGGATTQSNYGTFQTATSMNMWFGTGNQAVSGPIASGNLVPMKLWIMFQDGSFAVHDNGSGTPLKFQLQVP